MKAFAAVVTLEEALERYLAALWPQPRGEETVPLERALDRVCAADIRAAEDLPPFHRSTVDGYAVRSQDLLHASPRAPVALQLVGSVQMGEVPDLRVEPGQCARVPTGGVVPTGADAVVMQEHTQAEGQAVHVFRPVALGENVLHQGEDARRGEVVIRRGTRLRPQELGLLAGLGVVDVPCYLPPRVAVFSTGDELVPPDCQPRPGQVRDMNAYTLTAQVARLGGVPRFGGILPDQAAVVEAALRDAMRTADVVLASGGSSVGVLDVLGEVVPRLGQPGVVVHGVAIKPGKPTLLAVCDGKAVVGLPGHPASAMVVFDLLVRPVLEAMLGIRPDARGPRTVPANLVAPLTAPRDRDEFVRVRLRWQEDVLAAEPVLGKSGMITTMTRADGYVRVPTGTQLDAGTSVEVRLFD
ncbi:MAG: molybdopterin molybdotransferase MoeA [Armatimonadota bacterium]|nr:molybdopterin molybdotransferase MoeA [Armatimonadota bacterium]MDW8155300.1 molybdopterin molybdotransferase MoeA [Armatimonadota bacterium]